jgi:hypothetical protein
MLRAGIVRLEGRNRRVVAARPFGRGIAERGTRTDAPRPGLEACRSSARDMPVERQTTGRRREIDVGDFHRHHWNDEVVDLAVGFLALASTAVTPNATMPGWSAMKSYGLCASGSSTRRSSL